jgi:hypothetical protein
VLALILILLVFSGGGGGPTSGKSAYGQGGMDIGDTNGPEGGAPEHRGGEERRGARARGRRHDDGSGGGVSEDNMPKHPLRIDMRNNNPSKEALEYLLESVDYKSGVRKCPIFLRNASVPFAVAYFVCPSCAFYACSQTTSAPRMAPRLTRPSLCRP